MCFFSKPKQPSQPKPPVAAAPITQPIEQQTPQLQSGVDEQANTTASIKRKNPGSQFQIDLTIPTGTGGTQGGTGAGSR